LKVSADACGTFTFSLSNNINETFIANPTHFPIFALPLLEALSLEVAEPSLDGACCIENAQCIDGATVDQCTAPAAVFHLGETCDNISCGAIPTVSEWGLAVLGLALLIAAKISFGRTLPLLENSITH
jgi:hypothetical protein